MERGFVGSLVVIVPCYEPSEKEFVPYAKRLIDAGIKKLLIVDDGSGEKYAHVFSKVESFGAVVISYEKNAGKGHALKTAFKYCKENFDGKTVFVTADCDGQHTVEDVFRVAEVAWEKSTSFILGSRDFYNPNVPKRSRAGNLWTRRAFKALYGVKLNDTQTGLRAFGYSFLDELIKIRGERFEYEMNQLIVLPKKGVEITEVPIETIYREKSDDVEKVSHYRTLRDSSRVFFVLMSNISWYAVSGIVSALLDMGAFYVFFKYVYNGLSSVLQTLYATITARVISSIFNSIFNFKVVFKGKSPSCFVRYYMLWTVQLAASFGVAKLWELIIPSTFWLTALKGICDMLIAILSYQIQCNWVFKDKHTKTNFYGPFARVGRFFMNMFMRPRYTSAVSLPETGVMYVCRHLNMHGPITVTRNLGFDTHLMVYNVFFSFGSAYKHYSRITYAKNGKSTLKSKIKAFFVSLFVPRTMKSTKAIPVYRKDTRAITTLKNTVKYLEQDESVCVFPDIEYKAGEEKSSDIYKGFLIIEKMYFKRTGKHVKFVPIVIDEENACIVERRPIVFSGEMPFDEEMPIVAEKIKEAIGD